MCWGQRLSLLGGCLRVSLQLPVQVSSDIGHRLVCVPDTVYLCTCSVVNRVSLFCLYTCIAVFCIA